MNGDVVVENGKKSMVLGATVRPRHKDHIKPQQCPSQKPSQKQDNLENPHESCESCQYLLENSCPVVDYTNVSRTDVLFDRTLYMYKLTGKPAPEEDTIPPVKRQLDRFEESKFWDLIGLTPKMYQRLDVQLKKISPRRLVYKKCPYRLHNTRHFAVPLNKKAGKKEDMIKANYEDDRKLVKKNQAYDCHWEDCMHSFRDPQDMRIHYMFDHESVRVFCCGQRYDNYDAFLEHYVTSSESKKHAFWSARECWGCLKRFVDVDEFSLHADICELQMTPFVCPDPLCPMKYETATESVDHFFLWHDPSGSLLCNNVEYLTRGAIERDLPLIDDGQLILAYPLRAVYRCHLCHVQFASEQYFSEHMRIHVEQPQYWLVPTILFCMKCNVKNCHYLRNEILETIPKLMKLPEMLDYPDCRKSPMLLIWRIFLTDEFNLVMKRIQARLIAEEVRLVDEPKVGFAENHKEMDSKRVSYILDSLFYLYTQPYEKDQNSRRSRF